MDFRKQQLDFEEVDRRYAELKLQLDAGTISTEEFDEQLKRLMVQDDEGRWWAKSRKTGEWNYHDGTTWVKRIPPTVQSTTRATPSTEERVPEYQPQVERREAWWRRKEVLGAIAAAFAGATWIVLGFIHALGAGSPGSVPPGVFAGGVLLMQVGTLVGLMGLRMQQPASYRGLPTIGFLVASISIACLLVYTVIYLITPDPTVFFQLDWLRRLTDGLVVLEHLGLVFIGIAYLRARVLPPWASIALILGAVLLTIIEFHLAPWDDRLMTAVAHFVFGFIWIALGYSIWSRRSH